MFQPDRYPTDKYTEFFGNIFIISFVFPTKSINNVGFYCNYCYNSKILFYHILICYSY